jgi:hypothetical protein
MDRKEDGHQRMERDRQLHVIEVCPFLDRVDRDKYHCEQIEDYTMIDRTYAALERAKCEEFLGRPDFIDTKAVLDFFLLHCLLVELS